MCAGIHHVRVYTATAILCNNAISAIYLKYIVQQNVKKFINKILAVLESISL